MGSLATIPGIGTNPDMTAFFGGGGSNDQTQDKDQSLSLASTAPQATPLSTLSLPTTPLTTPTGGAGDSEEQVYAPQKPNLLSYNTGIGSMQSLYQQIYGKDEPTGTKPPGQEAIAEAPDQAAATTDDTAAKAVQHGQQFIEDTNRAVGNATTFGLDYGTGGADEMDKGVSAFGHNTADKNLEGASLPVSVIKNSIGDYTKDPKIFNAIRNGDYKVAVSNQDGTTKLVNIVDAGPAEWTGNAVDLTYKTSHDLNTEGKAKVGYQIIGPDGHPMPIKGYHPDSVSRVNYDDHIGPMRQELSAQTNVPSKGGSTEDLSASTDNQYLLNRRAQEQAAQKNTQLPSGLSFDTDYHAEKGSFKSGRPGKIEGIILHSSDGRESGDINTLTKGGVSAHYYVTQDGRIYNLVNDNDTAYHAGKTAGPHANFNNANTIGIEQEHYDPGGKGGKNGEAWSDKQVQATAKLVSYLKNKYGIEDDHIMGHSDIAPERKQDPYNYPWDNFHKYVNAGGGSETTGDVVAKATDKAAEQPEEKVAETKEPEEKKEETPPPARTAKAELPPLPKFNTAYQPSPNTGAPKGATSHLKKYNANQEIEQLLRELEQQHG